MNEFYQKLPIIYTYKKSGRTLVKDRIYICCGGIPEPVIEQLRNIESGGKYKESILVDYFGAKWKNSARMPELKEFLGSKNSARGGADLLFSEDDDDISNVSEMISAEKRGSASIYTGAADLLFSEDDLANVAETIVAEKKIAKTKSEARSEIYSTIQILPDDNFLDLRVKIAYLTGIEPYLQHISFYSDSVATNYTINSDRGPIDTDLLSIYTDNYGNGDVPINEEIYALRKSMTITSLDFTPMFEINYKYGTETFHVIDMNVILPRENCKNLDVITADVLYHSFVVRFFPLITESVWSVYQDPKKNVVDYFPLIVASKEDEIRAIRQSDFLDDLYTFDMIEDIEEVIKKEIKAEITFAITNTIIDIINNVETINYRGFFDDFILKNYGANFIIFYSNEMRVVKHKVFEEPVIENFIDGILIDLAVILPKYKFDELAKKRISIFISSTVTIRTFWQESDGVDFNSNFDIISEVYNNFVDKVNRYQKCRLPKISKANYVYGGITYCMGLRTEINESEIKAFDAIMSEAVNLNIFNRRQVEEYLPANIKEYFLIKGMFKYDIDRFVKLTRISNMYDYLTNSDYNVRWRNMFEHNRIFRVEHLQHGLKIIQNNVREPEFRFSVFLSAYLFYLFSIAEKHKVTTTTDLAIKNLMNLRSIDPVLYDLKRLYNSNIVFSKKCQKPKQPKIITDEEYKKMSVKDREKLTKYWNFTREESAYYQCPNSAYPYFGFVTGIHPRGYCMPCCKKLESFMPEKIVEHVHNKNAKKGIQRREFKNPRKEIAKSLIRNRKDRVYSQCLNTHSFADKVKTHKVKYIVGYGKTVSPGRLSFLPNGVMENIFYGNSNDPECRKVEVNYYLFGVAQNTQSVNDCGYLYIIANVADMTVAETVESLAKRVEGNEDIFRRLNGGAILLDFASASEFADEMRAVFINGKLTEFAWNPIFKELLEITQNVKLLIFEDTGIIRLRIQASITKPDEVIDMSNEQARYMIVLERKDEVYPIYYLDKDDFYGNNLIADKFYSRNSPVVQTIYKILAKTLTNDAVFTSIVDLQKIGKIKSQFIDSRSLCWGVQFEGTNVFMPTNTNAIDLPKKLGVPTTLADLKTSFKFWHEHVDGFKEPYVALIYRKKVVAIRSNNVNYYCDDDVEAVNEIAKKYKLKIFTYEVVNDPLTINEILFEHPTPTKNEQDTKIGESIYVRYIFELIMINIIHKMSKEKNADYRKVIKSEISKTNFRKGGDIENLSNALNIIFEKEIIKYDNDQISLQLRLDLRLLRRQLSAFTSSSESSNADSFLEIFNTSHYNFDNMTLFKIFILPEQEAQKIFNSMIKDVIKIGTPKYPSEYTNIISPCPNLFCDEKLIITQKDADKMLPIAFSDIRNPIKYPILDVIYSEFLIDYLRFKRQPGEKLIILFSQK